MTYKRVLEYLGQVKPPVPSLHSAPMYDVPSMPSGLRCANPILTFTFRLTTIADVSPS